MKARWFAGWLSSKQPRKQRKYVFNAPLHKRHALVSAHLNKELMKKHGRRSFPIRKGDRVKIVRGQYRGTIGEVERVDLKKYRINIKGAEHKKTEGRTSYYPIHPSNVIILTLKLDDKKRKQALERKEVKKKEVKK
jgi:large subunit ribosomal protein L24